MAGNSNTSGTTVSSRLLAILAAYSDEHRRMSLSDISRRCGMPLSTTHRLCGELVEWGALRRESDGRFALGRRMWELGLLAPVQVEVRQVASPFLHDIFAATEATVHLAIREDIKALYLERLSGNRSVRVISSIGSKLPLHTTAVGKVLLAHAPDLIVARAFRSLSRETAYSIVAPGILAAQLARARRFGFAQTEEEMSLGASSVAVPVADGHGHVHAALGIVVPKLGREEPRLVAALKVASAGITRQWTALER